MAETGETHARDRPTVIGTLVWWATYVLLYLSFVDLSWTQLAAGAVVAAVSVALSRLGLRASGLRFAGDVPAIWRLRAIGRIVVTETATVVAALTRQLTGRRPVAGRFVAIHVPEVVEPGLDSVITLEASLAPNTYVVAYLDEPELLLLHQFEPRDEVRRSFPRWSR